ncbi:NUDIX domain-containing protein [candidate division KSB1 bacterium]|nr:NUDIX domain-containing protein [candidate division KSB1 bacterium]NIT74262.1 NUDIX domain-containing protein [candidate division KSB1 bacterium]NIW72675.1 NUDIX domain-containing protein [candidate division KSB1 bacterium]NIX73942.1 NUDIX domain-containing protein [candidate division KSB1 bacterium]
MDDPSELFDVVDAQDRVIRQATRGEVHAQNLLHRSVHILVFNSREELFLQKRVATKDENPGFWDTSAAGHVNAGEDYLTCAHRELKEELGISGELKFLRKFPASRETLWEHVEVYRCRTDQKICINPAEISEGRFWTLPSLETAIEKGVQPFTSTFQLIFFTCLKSKT